MVTVDFTTVNRPGICGIYGTAEHPGGRVLITDDRAAPLLEALLPNLYPRMVNVFREAARCTDLLRKAARWQGEPATFMVCLDLSGVPTTLALPAGLFIRRVHRVPSDPRDGVPLEDAARACLDADPQMGRVSLPGFLDYLRSLPPTTQLLAAVDAGRGVRDRRLQHPRRRCQCLLRQHRPAMARSRCGRGHDCVCAELGARVRRANGQPRRQHGRTVHLPPARLRTRQPDHALRPPRSVIVAFSPA